MVGQGVLHECLRDPGVESVVTIGRSAAGVQDAKLREIVHADLYDLAALDLSGFDACFFCLGVSVAGMSEEAYAHVTYDLAVGTATQLARLNPQMTFIYVSGAGTDSTERGRSMWARVKGRTENAILRLPFKAYMFRPAIIQPMRGVRSKTKSYRVFYLLAAPFLPLARRLFPSFVTTTERIGRAMLKVARQGAPARVLETRDISLIADR